MNNADKLKKRLGGRLLPPVRVSRAISYEVATIDQKGTISSHYFKKLEQAKAYFVECQERGENVQPIAKYKGEEFQEEIYF